ncbi:glycogen debranching protein GlgX [Opacimonas viscosa]|uniref:Glycogen debranching protein GlgX n=1 Tax=Opacimonas viscosa TaxID=2961944 RepID=A0AA41X311_9ALTE|nr:glycogen debranching protein GlgX [Opacimonas viscosa]MCP3428578.1 glycogen debranching protein GlgX [Opacimonas viscosa]
MLDIQHSALVSHSVPLGASWSGESVNFAIHAPKVKQLRLCFFHPDTNELLAVYEVRHRTKDTWHIAVPKMHLKHAYIYQAADVEKSVKDSGRVLSNKDLSNVTTDDETVWRFVSDPYAKTLTSLWHWDETRYQQTPEAFFPKALLHTLVESDNPKQFSHTPVIAPKDRVIYEAHVKGMTRLHPQVAPELRGTYLGMGSAAVIAHLKALGVTTVQLMPLMAFMPEPFITEKGLTNYWGYNPVSFFAPEPRYAKQDAHSECREMIATLKAAGLEVILDVVFNHTAEAGPDGPTISFRGLDDHYYTQMPDTGHYANYSGCGNVLNLEHIPTMNLVLDAMRHWVNVYGIDGFRFDLATGLGREPHTFNPRAAFFKALQQDPVLQNKILLAEPWDIGDYGYQLGSFPKDFLEVNDQFRDSVRGFWRGDRELTATYATRMFGSRDIFHKGQRAIHTSVNPITYHDGFTLHDIVTYNNKHNDANLEDNRDGHNHNLSYNYGVEGETDDVVIQLLRARQKRNLFAAMIFAQGTPHILGGDELSKTQMGNNNAYCQDNELNYLHWDLDQQKQDFLMFCQYCVALKQSSEVLTNVQLADDTYYADVNVAQVNWYKIDGSDKGDSDWHLPNVQGFGFEIIGQAGLEDNTNEHWLLCVNAAMNDEMFRLPKLAPGSRWQVLLDTRMTKFKPDAFYIPKPEFVISNRSIVLFKKEQI